MATEDTEWALNKKSKLWIPKHKKRTGFEDKTRWDQLQLLAQVVGAFAIPLSIIGLIIGVWQFNAQQAANQAQALDQQHQTTLDTYLDRMSDLLLMDHLRTNSDAQALAVARTFTALRNLDGTRKGYLIKYLWDAQLINEPHVILPMPGADLSDAVFAIANQHPNLSSISLIFDILYRADLSGVILAEANLSNAYLGGANLSNTNLEGTNLNSANLNGTNLQGAIYNSAPIQIHNTQGGICLTLKATQWPQGFNPKVAGACDLLDIFRGYPCPGRSVLLGPC